MRRDLSQTTAPRAFNRCNSAYNNSPPNVMKRKIPLDSAQPMSKSTGLHDGLSEDAYASPVG